MRGRPRTLRGRPRTMWDWALMLVLVLVLVGMPRDTSVYIFNTIQIIWGACFKPRCA